MGQRFVDASGEMVPVGSIRRNLTADFVSSPTLPSWLETPNGTAAIASPGQSSTGLTLTTGAVSGNLGTVRTSFDLDISQFSQIIWQAEGVYLSADTLESITFGIHNSTSFFGATLYQDVTSNPTARVIQYTGSTSVTTNIPYAPLGGGEGIRHRNLTLDLRPRLKEIYIMEGDSIISALDIATLGLGNCRPTLEVTTKSAAARSISVSQLKLSLIHD